MKALLPSYAWNSRLSVPCIPRQLIFCRQRGIAKQRTIHVELSIRIMLSAADVSGYVASNSHLRRRNELLRPRLSASKIVLCIPEYCGYNLMLIVLIGDLMLINEELCLSLGGLMKMSRFISK